MTAVHIARAHRAQERIESCRCTSTVAFNKDAFPTRQHSSPANPFILLVETSQGQLCCVSLQAQYQAFVHFAVGERRSSSHRAQQDLRLGTVT